uniref:C2H2-type domain-containing protein n=1 Tax=Echeneis naucrates TaxID=173247 RepID=A0A665T0U3_ECHNA
MEKVFLPNCGNSDISELATDGSNSFPSSFATDSQGFKQDCRIIDSSFPEDFSDVISCSDLDGLETKPSCKFMESNSVPKPKTDDVTKCHSSEQLISQSRNMVLCSDTSAANINPSNVKAEEIIVLTSTEHNQSFPPSNSVTVRGSETAEDTNCHEGCQDHEQEDDVERNPIEGKHSDISISGNGNAATDGLVESPNGSDGGQITAAAPIHNEPYPLEEKKLRKEMEELFNRESEGSENLSLACDQNEMSKGDQDQNERKIFGSLENETFDKQSTPLLCSTDSQDENMQTDCKGEKNMSELEMRNHLQPVVLLKTLESEIEQKRQETPAIRAPKTFPRHKCNLCPAVFCYSSGKYRHMKKHELFKLTGKMFRYRNSVFSMSKTATPSNTNDEEGEMNRNPALSCEFCGKYFATSQSLKKHERSHRGERPYHCLECGKGFKRHSHLIVHKKSKEREPLG